LELKEGDFPPCRVAENVVVFLKIPPHPRSPKGTLGIPTALITVAHAAFSGHGNLSPLIGFAYSSSVPPRLEFNPYH